MPTLEWIGKDKVVNHHQEVPYRVLERQYTYGRSKGKKQRDVQECTSRCFSKKFIIRTFAS